MSISAFDYTFGNNVGWDGHTIPSDEKAFEALFKTYYARLIFFANRFVNDEDVSREMVSEVFTRLWEERNSLSIKTSVNAYLYRTVQNRCLNYLKHKKIESEYVNYLARHNMLSEIPALHRNPAQERELKEQIHKAIEELPEKCRDIFKLSRFKNMKNKEIAESLQISQKTVERHMTIALDRLRQGLKHLLVLASVLLNTHF
ncbi:RNA polymerase sigma-70 factor [Desertivirga arenae]|uniref:RNA polymerase sigma-70 factor n=1 Tax=Desertivirga arenae TaxID=2810309 RepID=UPI001A957C64|nr:RNA polymerase sigma-70 factor [Pedobacter sp. SYSU D00823]